MEPDKLLDRLKLLPKDPLDELCYRLGLPHAHSEGKTPTQQAIALLRWCGESGQIAGGLATLSEELTKVQPTPVQVTGNTLPALEVRFHSELAVQGPFQAAPSQRVLWRFEVFKRGMRVRNEAWSPPEQEQAGSILDSLLGRSSAQGLDEYGQKLFEHLMGTDPDLRDHRWQLRITGNSSNGQGLPDAPWWRLLLPPHGESLYDLGWTLCEHTSPPMAAQTNGRVLIIGDPGLKQELRPWLGPDLHDVSLDEVIKAEDLPETSLWIVGPALNNLTPEHQRAIQMLAAHHRCPLIVWCAQRPASRARVGEVVCVGRPLERKKGVRWLAHFLSWLKDPNGLPPEQAFAKVNRADPLARLTWWLRGSFDRWEVTTPDYDRPEEFLHDWYRRIDRRLQEGGLTDLLEPLLKPHNTQRVLVVLVPGEQQAGLALFRERPLKLPGQAQMLSPRRPAWSEKPSEQIKMLYRLEGKSNRSEFVAALKRRAGSRVTLLPVFHQTLFLSPRDAGPDQLPLATIPEEAELYYEEDLRAYLRELENLAVALQDQPNTRLYIHISVIGRDKKGLEALIRGEQSPGSAQAGRSPHQSVSAPYRWNVLPEIKAPVPFDELQMWAEHRGVALSDEELQGLASRPYEEILEIQNS